MSKRRRFLFFGGTLLAARTAAARFITRFPSADGEVHRWRSIGLR